MGQGQSVREDDGRGGAILAGGVVVGPGVTLSSEQVQAICSKYRTRFGGNQRQHVKVAKARQFVLDLCLNRGEKELLLWIECNATPDGRVFLGDLLTRAFDTTETALTTSAQTYVDSVSSERRAVTSLGQLWEEGQQGWEQKRRVK